MDHELLLVTKETPQKTVCS